MSELASAKVLTLEGHEVELGSLWATSDVVIVFVRHFACAGCAEHVAELRPRIAELAKLGVRVALVGNGSREQLAAFVEREKLAGYPIDTYTDPTRAAYRAAGFERSWSSVVDPRALAKLVRLLGKGYRNGKTEGDLAQQGGTLYVKRGGEIAMHHRSKRIGDRASTVDVVRIALAARAEKVAIA